MTKELKSIISELLSRIQRLENYNSFICMQDNGGLEDSDKKIKDVLTKKIKRKRG